MGGGQVRQHSVLGARVGVSCTAGSMSRFGELRKVRIDSSVPTPERRGIEGRHKGPTTHGYGDSRERIRAFLFSSNASLTLIFDYLLRSFLKGTYCVWLPRQLVSTSGIFTHKTQGLCLGRKCCGVRPYTSPASVREGEINSQQKLLVHRSSVCNPGVGFASTLSLVPKTYLLTAPGLHLRSAL